MGRDGDEFSPVLDRGWGLDSEARRLPAVLMGVRDTGKEAQEEC